MQKKPSIAGILVGLVTVVACSIVFSLLSLALFAELVARGPDDILTTSTGPLLYAVCVLFVSVVLGIFVCARVAGRAARLDAALVVLLYAAFTYALSRSPSNLNTAYPAWFVLSQYLVLLPAAAVGHVVARRSTRSA